MASPSDQTVNLTCDTEYPDYKHNEEQDIYTLVSIKSPTQPENENEDKRPPVDVVAVIDISGSMSGAKLALIKKTLHYFLTQLTAKDRLSLVTYDTNVYLPFGLTYMTNENKENVLQKIENLTTGSTTNLCGGLMKGLVQIIDRNPDTKNDVASVLLFTDGLANHGIQNAAGIVAAMEDPKRVDGPSPETPQSRSFGEPPRKSQIWLQRAMGAFPTRSAPATRSPPSPPATRSPPSPPASRSRPDMEIETMRPTNVGKKADASVYTFGFGEDHDPSMLKAISDAGNGMYYFIENEDQVAESFGHCLGGIMSTVAQGIQLEIKTKDGISIKEVNISRPMEKTNTSCKVNIGDLQSEESRDVVIVLKLNALLQPQTNPPQELFEARYDCFNVITGQLENKNMTLTVLRPNTPQEHSLENACRSVRYHKERVEMTRAMKEIDQEASRGNLVQAQKIAATTKQKMKSQGARYRSINADDAAGMYDDLGNELELYEENLQSNAMWNQKGKKVASNLIQQQEVQRSSNARSVQFATKMKKQGKSRARAFVEEE